MANKDMIVIFCLLFVEKMYFMILDTDTLTKSNPKSVDCNLVNEDLIEHNKNRKSEIPNMISIKIRIIRYLVSP